MKNFKWDYVFYTAFVILIVGTLIRSYFVEKQEFGTDYNFEITDFEITAKKEVTLYSGDKRIAFSLFSLRERDSIKKGDFIVKEKGAPYLYIYRKDSLGLKQLYSKVKGHNTWVFHGFQ